MKKLIKENPNTAYFALTFGWTWLIVILLIISGNAKDVNNPTPFFVIAAMLSGISPSASAFIVTGITKGRSGIKEITERLKRKSGIKWYLLTLLLVPSLTLITTAVSNFCVRSYEINIVFPIIMLGLIWPLFSSIGEEFGWRGYILPQLLPRYGSVKSGILLGIIWATWHIPMDYIAYKDYGIYIIPAYLLICYANLILQAVIMTFIYVRTKGNLKLMVLYHYTITGSAIILGGFLKAEALPKYTVYESMISVTLLAATAAVIYLFSRKKIEQIREEVLC